MKKNLNFEFSLEDFFSGGVDGFMFKMGELDFEDNGVYSLSVKVMPLNGRGYSDLCEIYDYCLDFSSNNKSKLKRDNEVLSDIYADEIYSDLEDVLDRFLVWEEGNFLVDKEKRIVYLDSLYFYIKRVD